MNRFLKKLSLIIVALILVFLITSVYSEGQMWNCPECGRTGNTGNYCGGCAHPAPWFAGETQTIVIDKTSAIFGLNLYAEDFDQQAQVLIDQAKTWTEKSAPQTLDSFPLIPESVFQLYDNIAADPIKLEKRESQYYLTTTIHDIVSDWVPDYQSIQLEYVKNNAYQRVDLTRIDDYTFTFSLPTGVKIDDIDLSWSYHWPSIGSSNWQEVLQIEHKIKNGKINDDLFVGIILSNNSYSLSWYPGFSVYNRYDKNIISIDIYSFVPNQRIWQLDYNTKTGKLIRIYQ